MPSAGHTAHAAGLAVFGHTPQRSLAQSFADASLAASLDGVRVPVLLAQVQARARPAPPHAHPQPAAPAGANGTR